jgi:hypothetical protein
MPYTLNFSNPSKLDITVPDMPPGINSVSTSLDLVGPGYPNYGGKIAGNFLHLLENFSSPSAPERSIEGQLWYDTSDPNNKILKVMTGSTSSSRWAPVSGVYRQAADPRNTASISLKSGDIWVDTTNRQLKIFIDNAWILIGPADIGNTGVVVSTIDSATSNTSTSIIKYVVEGVAVAIFSNVSITPRTVIDGFTTLTPGINLNARVLNPLQLNGTASSANALNIEDNIFSSSSFLRKDDSTKPGQIITGNIIFQQPDTDINSGFGTYGIVINSELDNFVQLYNGSNNGILCNNSPGSKLIFKTRGIQDIVPTSIVELSKVMINLNTSTTVFGSLSVTNKLSLGITSTSGTVLTPNSTSCDIGAAQKPFRRIYASEIGSADSVIYGTPASGGYFRPGMIIAWAGADAPTGWALCNGATYNKADYPILSGIFNTDPTSTQFEVPNFNTSSSTPGLTYIIKTDDTDYAI